VVDELLICVACEEGTPAQVAASAPSQEGN
jgi:hypothetical protein